MRLKFLQIAMALAAFTIGSGAVHDAEPTFAAMSHSVGNEIRQPSAPPSLGDRRDFTLVNASSSVSIVHVYVSPAIIDDWEEDVLGEDVLDPGDNMTIHFNGFDGSGKQCLYDVRVDGDQGEHGYLYGIDLCSIDTVTFS